MILFGVLFSFFANPKRQASVLTDPFLWHCFVFTTIFNAAVLYAIKHYPDWMWMYFLEDSKNTVPELIYLFVFLYYFPVIFGYFLGRDIRRVSLLFWFVLILLLIAAEVWIVMHLFGRYSVVGTQVDYLFGNGVPLFGAESPLSTVMNASVGGMVVYFFFVVYLYRKRQKRLFKD